MNSDKKTINCLKSFFRKMNQWEIECHKQDRGLKEREIKEGGAIDWQIHERDRKANYSHALKTLTEIFHKYTTQSEPTRGVQYQKPPEYEPEPDIIETRQESENCVQLIVKQHTGFQATLIFELVRYGDE